jgi:hypothetical protein
MRLARVVEDLLEGLAVEKRLLERDARLAPHPRADLEMRLVDLREPLPLTCGTRASTVAPRARGARERAGAVRRAAAG